jgi:hypothetical protein
VSEMMEMKNSLGLEKALRLKTLVVLEYEERR